MATVTVYPVPGYPTVYLTEDHEQITIRPMVPQTKRLCWTFSVGYLRKTGST
jgi:hypothetical protein